MHTRGRLTGLAGAAAALLLLASPALAGQTAPPSDPTPGGPQRPYEPDVAGPENIDTLEATVTRDRAADSRSGKGVRVTFERTSRAEPAGPPAAPRRFVFLFDKSLSFRPHQFPVCSRATVERRGLDGCAEDSVIGQGTVGLYPEGEAPVHAVNTRHEDGSRGALVVIPETGAILELTWERVTAPYRERGYRWALDEIVPPDATPPEERVGTSEFELTFGGTRQFGNRSLSFVQSRARPGDELNIGLWSSFVTGQTILPETTAVRP